MVLQPSKHLYEQQLTTVGSVWLRHFATSRGYWRSMHLWEIFRNPLSPPVAFIMEWGVDRGLMQNLGSEMGSRDLKCEGNPNQWGRVCVNVNADVFSFVIGILILWHVCCNHQDRSLFKAVQMVCTVPDTWYPERECNSLKGIPHPATKLQPLPSTPQIYAGNRTQTLPWRGVCENLQTSTVAHCSANVSGETFRSS